MQTLVPVTIGEEWPRPAVLVFHLTSRRCHLAGTESLSKTPSRCGPRQPGQSGFQAFPLEMVARPAVHTTGAMCPCVPARNIAIPRIKVKTVSMYRHRMDSYIACDSSVALEKAAMMFASSASSG